MREIDLFADRLMTLTTQDIDNINKDSHIAYLKALYDCQNFILVDLSHTPTLTKKTFIQNFGYKDDFVIAFISHKDSLNNNYLQARKALHKSISQIKQEQAKELESQLQETADLALKQGESHHLQRMQDKALNHPKIKARFSTQKSKDFPLVLESKDKSIKIIFFSQATQGKLCQLNTLESHTISLSNLLHIHHNNCDIFTKDNSIIDINSLEKQHNINFNKLNTQIFLYSTLLQGSKEIESNPFFFGTLDNNNALLESKPIYHFIPKDSSGLVESMQDSTQTAESPTDSTQTAESANDSTDSTQTAQLDSKLLGTLQIYLDSHTLTLLNYDVLNSSLNIKLELTNKNSKALQQQAKSKTKHQQSKEKDKSLSFALLHPILEDDEIKCPHNGVVKLKANKGRYFKSKNKAMILESDLLNSTIIGCANNIAGIPNPCAFVSTILPSTRGLKKYNDDYPIMQDLVSSGVFSDKGFPLICTPKANSFKIDAPNPSNTPPQDKQPLTSKIYLNKPIIRLHYKIYPSQIDNLPIYKLKINDSIMESNTPLDSIDIDIADTKALEDISSLDTNLQDILSKMHSNLKQTYTKGYLYKYLILQLDSNALVLILLIPQNLPKVYKDIYKDYEYKDYGIGKYRYVYNHCTAIMLDIKDYTKDYTLLGLESNPSNATILTLHAPYKAQRLEIKLANGLDAVIESNDRKSTQCKIGDSIDSTDSKHNKQIIDSLLTIFLINGGYKQKIWSYGEERESITDKESRDFKETQENKERQILDIYFSYGEKREKVEQEFLNVKMI